MQAPPVPLRVHALTAAVLLVALGVLGWIHDFGRDAQALFDLALPVVLPHEQQPGSTPEDGDTKGLHYTPPFFVEGPTTLELVLEHDGGAGTLALAGALVDETRGQVREFEVFDEGSAEPSGPHREVARLDQLHEGKYRLRLEPAWIGANDEAPPELRLSARLGSRSPLMFGLAALLIVAPLLVLSTRQLVLTQRRKVA